jgi:hypothetical protein
MHRGTSPASPSRSTAARRPEECGRTSDSRKATHHRNRLARPAAGRTSRGAAPVLTAPAGYVTAASNSRPRLSGTDALIQAEQLGRPEHALVEVLGVDVPGVGDDVVGHSSLDSGLSPRRGPEGHRTPWIMMPWTPCVGSVPHRSGNRVHHRLRNPTDPLSLADRPVTGPSDIDRNCMSTCSCFAPSPS